ncbi:MAG: hypothetical protein JWO62_3032 [Acidimicrobiaceae bacterium]|nr:hypothetical protein [Acidimicrobiaceae bacterium]
MARGSSSAASGPGGSRRAARLARTAAIAASIAVPIGCSAAFIPLRDRLPNLDLALALVVVVMALSISGRRTAVIGGALAASLSFEFFATRPYDELAIARQPDLETTVVLAIVALVAGECSRRVVRQRVASATQTANFDSVRLAARMLADGNEPIEVVGAVATEIGQLLNLSDCRFEALPPSIGATRVARDGSLVTGSEESSARAKPLGWAELPVFSQGEQLGYFALRFAAGSHVGPEQLRVAVTLADQVGAALGAYGPAVAPPPDAGPVARGLHLLS